MLSTIFWIIVACLLVEACIVLFNIGYKKFLEYMEERNARKGKKW